MAHLQTLQVGRTGIMDLHKDCIRQERIFYLVTVMRNGFCQVKSRQGKTILYPYLAAVLEPAQAVMLLIHNVLLVEWQPPSAFND